MSVDRAVDASLGNAGCYNPESIKTLITPIQSEVRFSDVLVAGEDVHRSLPPKTGHSPGPLGGGG